LSFKIELSKKHPLDELHDLIRYIKGFPLDVFSGPKLLFILPDGISIDNAKERITEKFNPKEMRKIEFLTFEQLGAKIIESKERTPEIVPTEIRRLLIVESIREMAEGDNVLAKNIWDLVKGSPAPENEEIIKDIDAEFEDFLRCVYPPQLEDGKKKEYLYKMEEIADGMDGAFYKKTVRDALHFYTELELLAMSKLKTLDRGSYYLSRTHMVGEAAESLKKDKSLFKRIFSDVSKVWISSISVFDVPILEFINAIKCCGLSVRINTGSLSAERLEKRLKKGWGIETQSVGSDNSRKLTDYELVELPDMRREAEYVISDIANKIIEEKIDAEDVVVFARDVSQYMPYVEAILGNYGLSGYVQTRRSLALTPAFRLAASLLNLFSLIESNKDIKASDITDPIRLGFTARWGQKPLRDSTFLWVETRVGSIGGAKEHKWTTWKKRLERINHNRLKEFIEWIDNKIKEPSCKPIESVLIRFETGCSDWKTEYKSSSGFTHYRHLLTEEHITSHAHRILSHIHRIENFANVSKEIRGDKAFSWTDLMRAFYGIAGSETYGVPNRDSHAIRFIDAGNAHFIDGKIRYIFGLKSKGFPRQCPTGMLLVDEYRKKINETHGPLYLRDPATDYENEHDFFEATVGPNQKARLIFTMPYLDDRGHKEEWSVFVNKVGKKIDHIKASEFVIPQSELISPRAHWRQASISIRGSAQITDNYKRCINSLWNDIVEVEILPRLRTFEHIVINRDLEIEIDEKEERYLKEFIDDVRNNPIPVHEINLYEECPVMYYFYKYLYCLGPYTSGLTSGKREYVPEWKFDFRLGPIPLPVRRRHISTKAESLLENILKVHNTSKKLKDNKSALLSEIYETKDIDYLTKSLFIKIIDYLIESNSNKITFSKAKQSSLDEELWRSAYIKIDRNYFVHLARCNPRRRGDNSLTPHVLHGRFSNSYVTREVIVPGTNRSYSNRSYYWINNDDYENIKEGIMGLSFDMSRIHRDRCEDCVYKSLCGDWGFD